MAALLRAQWADMFHSADSTTCTLRVQIFLSHSKNIFTLSVCSSAPGWTVLPLAVVTACGAAILMAAAASRDTAPLRDSHSWKMEGLFI